MGPFPGAGDSGDGAGRRYPVLDGNGGELITIADGAFYTAATR